MSSTRWSIPGSSTERRSARERRLAPLGDGLDQVGRSDRARGSLEAARDRAEADLQRIVREETVDRARQLGVLEVIGSEADAEAGLRDPLGVVDLVPEERQHDPRL